MHKTKYIKLFNLDTNQELTLDSKLTNNEPTNLENSSPVLKRSTKNLSFTTTYSKDVVFTGSGARFLIDAYAFRGTEADVIYVEYRFNEQTDEEYEFLNVELNFSQYSEEGGTVKVPALTGGLASVTKARLSDSVELDRVTDLDGNDIEPVTTNRFEVTNRPLELKSLIETESEDSVNTSVYRMKYNSSIYYRFFPIPLSLTYESDDSVGSVFSNQQSQIPFSKILNTNDIAPIHGLSNVRSQCFYYNSDANKTIKATFVVKINAKLLRDEDLSSKHFSIRLAKLTGRENPVFSFPTLNISEIESGSNFPELDNFETLIQGNNLFTSENEYFTATITKSINLLKGDSLMYCCFAGGNFIESSGNAYLNINLSDIDCSINIYENSTRTDLNRNVRCYRNEEVGKTLMNILSGSKEKYLSSFFSSSTFKNTALSSGKMIRSISRSTVSTSLKNFLDNANTLFSMGYNIEKINGKETLVHEKIEHFFRPEVIITLPNQVSKLSRKPATEFMASTIKSGYAKPSGDNLYEEVNGQNEVNVENEYILPMNRVVKDYDLVSPYRADSEGKTLTLRQTVAVNPTGDYRTDNTIFNLDLKPTETGVFKERTWVDDFEEPPLNVFSPDTMTGLRITPFRNMKRHFPVIGSQLTKLQDKYIRYTSTRGSSIMETKIKGGEYIKENGNYLISSIESAIFVNEWIEFEYPVSNELLDKINGYTIEGNRKIPNIYYKIQFINDKNEFEYGYLFELKPNKEGKWKILKAL